MCFGGAAEEAVAQGRRSRGGGGAGSPDVDSAPPCRGRATAPIAKSGRPPVALLPCGSSASSASSLTLGHARPGAEKRIGAPDRRRHQDRGGDRRRAQSSSSTRVTAAGRCAGVVEGKTASATPAAFAAGSEPPTRVVLSVAKPG